MTVAESVIVIGMNAKGAAAQPKFGEIAHEAEREAIGARVIPAALGPQTADKKASTRKALNQFRKSPSSENDRSLTNSRRQTLFRAAQSISAIKCETPLAQARAAYQIISTPKWHHVLACAAAPDGVRGRINCSRSSRLLQGQHHNIW